VTDLIEDEDPSNAHRRLEEGLRNKALDKKQLGQVIGAALLHPAGTPQLREYLYQLVERHRLKDVWPALVQLAEREDQDAEYALSYLQRLRPPKEAFEAIVRIIPRLRSSSSALEMLLQMKVERPRLEAAVKTLLEADGLDDLHTYLMNYIQSGRLPAPLSSLLACWDREPHLRQYYLPQAIQRATPDESVEKLLEWLKSPDPEAASLAADYVLRHRVARAVPALIEAIKSDGGGVHGFRAKLVQTLKALNPEEQMRPWIAAGGGPLPRADLLDLAADLQLRSIAPDVVGCLKDPDPAIRRAATVTLGQLAYAQAAPALEGLLQDADSHVRTAALLALVRIQGPAATGIVLKHLFSEDAAVQAAALDAVPMVDLDQVVDELTKEANLTRHISRYALAVLVAREGERVLHRLMARAGERLSVEELNAMVRLIQSARGGR
jgi:hypothetical protein